MYVVMGTVTVTWQQMASTGAAPGAAGQSLRQHTELTPPLRTRCLLLESIECL